MKKKYVLLILCLCFIALLIVAYSKSKSTLNSISSSLDPDIVETGKSHKVIRLSKDSEIEYQYWVFDNKGDVMYNDKFRKQPNFSYLDGDILQKETGGGNVRQFQFFNTAYNLISPIYDNPTLVNKGKIVYMAYENDRIRLIVSDLFDKSKLYKEYERNFSPVAAPYNDLISAKFIDSCRLQITYLSGEDFKEVSEIITLD